MHLQDALDRYAVQLAASGRSPITIDQARRYVGLLLRWLQTTGGPTDVGAIGHEHVAGFLASPAALLMADGRPRKASSLNVSRTTLRVFGRYLVEAGYTARNPARLVQLAPCGKPPPRALPPADCKRLLAVLARERDAAGRRDWVLFSLVVATGIRIGSALGLRVEDLDLGEGVAVLRVFKGGRTEQVFLPPKTVTMLRDFLRGRREGPVFVGARGEAITTRHARRRLGQALTTAGITRRYSWHSLRHALALRLLAKTGNLRLVQRALHHKDISSTCRYADVSDAAVRRALSA